MPLYFQHFDGDSSKLGMSDKNSAKRDTEPLKGCDPNLNTNLNLNPNLNPNINLNLNLN